MLPFTTLRFHRQRQPQRAGHNQCDGQYQNGLLQISTE